MSSIISASSSNKAAICSTLLWPSLWMWVSVLLRDSGWDLITALPVLTSGRPCLCFGKKRHLDYLILLLPSGYSGPLKEAPCEKFNTTVIPRSYCSPWTAALGGHEELQNVLSAQLLQNLPPPVNYRCFNRLVWLTDHAGTKTSRWLDHKNHHGLLSWAPVHLSTLWKMISPSGCSSLLCDGYFKPWILKEDPPAFLKRFHRKGNRLSNDVNRITSG